MLDIVKITKIFYNIVDQFVILIIVTCEEVKSDVVL